MIQSKRITKSILIVMIVMLSLSTLTLFVGCMSNEIKIDDQIDLNKTHNLPKKLTFTEEALALAGSGGVSINIKATVLPVTAKNTKVDWEVSWGSAPTHGEKDVTEFVAVTANSDGSNLATITCYKLFNNDEIIVRVITRAGGLSATCKIISEGRPTNIDIDTSDLTTINESGQPTVYQLTVGQEYNLDIFLNSTLGGTNSSFVPDFKIDFIGVGEVEIEFNGDGDTKLTSFNLNENFKPEGGSAATLMGQMFFITLDNGKLKILPRKQLENITYQYRVDRYTSYTWKYSKTIGATIPYAKITVTETQTGLTKVINVRGIGDIESVNLDKTEVVF